MTYRAIYFDTETTGIKPDKDRIIELAAFDPDREASFEMLINPGIPIPPEASQVHHITDDMVADASSFGEVAQEFVKFCEGEVILIAHNNDAFDLPFLKTEFKRAELPFPEWKFLDSLKWARRYRPDLPRHALQILREMYQIPANNAHRALDDVIVLHKVFSFLIDDLSIDQAYALMHQKRKLQHMPFGKHQGKPLAEVPSSYVKWLHEQGALDKPENEELKERFSELGVLAG